MKMMKRVSSLVLAVMLVMALAVTAFAAAPTRPAAPSITYEGHKILNFWSPDETYTSTDLFGDFKNVMPGDERTEVITIQNTAKCCDYIKVYMYAKTHEAGVNDMHSSLGESSETEMNKFLAQLNLKVWADGELIYDDSPNLAGDLEKRTLIAGLSYGKEAELTAKLTVPSDLGNEFANRAGEVDWVFEIEEFFYNTPQTGDHTNPIPAIIFLSIGVAGMLLLMAGKRKKKQA